MPRWPSVRSWKMESVNRSETDQQNFRIGLRIPTQHPMLTAHHYGHPGVLVVHHICRLTGIGASGRERWTRSDGSRICETLLKGATRDPWWRVGGPFSDRRVATASGWCGQEGLDSAWIGDVRGVEIAGGTESRTKVFGANLRTRSEQAVPKTNRGRLQPRTSASRQ